MKAHKKAKYEQNRAKLTNAYVATL
jgi:hypothetical protein